MSTDSSELCGLAAPFPSMVLTRSGDQSATITVHEIQAQVPRRPRYFRSSAAARRASTSPLPHLCELCTPIATEYCTFVGCSFRRPPPCQTSHPPLFHPGVSPRPPRAHSLSTTAPASSSICCVLSSQFLYSSNAVLICAPLAGSPGAVRLLSTSSALLPAPATHARSRSHGPRLIRHPVDLTGTGQHDPLLDVGPRAVSAGPRQPADALTSLGVRLPFRITPSGPASKRSLVSSHMDRLHTVLPRHPWSRL